MFTQKIPLKESTMHNKQPACKRLKSLARCAITSLLCITALSAWAADSWKEEVLLHDGQKIIVERYVQRGGRHEIGQIGAYVEQTLAFKLPGNDQTVEWKDSLSPDLGTANFLPMLLDIAQGTPYLVVYPMGCLSYNKWGRPNPPYVVFKYDTHAWQRIPLESLPPELKTPNLIFSDPDITVEKMGKRVVSAETIQRIVAETKQAEYKAISREPVANAERDCGEMVVNGKGTWVGMGWFRKQPTYDACVNQCFANNFETQYCPCAALFKGNGTYFGSQS
jgi:hypothetical protein